MDKKVAIIGAGAAGVLAAMTLLEGGLDGSCITLIDPGTDPWNRTEDTFKGFMGAALGSNLVLAGEPDMGGNLCRYFEYDTATTLIQQVIEKVNTYIINNPQAEVVHAPYKHYKLEAESYKEVARHCWLILTRAKVEMVKYDFNYFANIVEGDIEVQQEDIRNFTYCIIAIGNEGFNTVYGQLTAYGVTFADSLPITQEKQAFLNEHIPQAYRDRSYASYPITTANMNLPTLPKIYLVGDVTGNNCLATAMVQGVLAAEDIVTKL